MKNEKSTIIVKNGQLIDTTTGQPVKEIIFSVDAPAVVIPKTVRK